MKREGSKISEIRALKCSYLIVSCSKASGWYHSVWNLLKPSKRFHWTHRLSLSLQSWCFASFPFSHTHRRAKSHACWSCKPSNNNQQICRHARLATLLRFHLHIYQLYVFIYLFTNTKMMLQSSLKLPFTKHSNTFYSKWWRTIQRCKAHRSMDAMIKMATITLTD